MSSNNRGSKRSNSGNSPGDSGNPNEPHGTKKAKTAASITDDLICPITHELPIDPVNAEDGQHYEREAIETHIKTQQENGQEVKSPITNDGMGPRLFPAHRIKNHIETLVVSGMITGELAQTWKKKKKLEKYREKLLQKAENGGLIAIYNSGLHYKYGENGFPKDLNQAYHWLKKGDGKGDNECTASLGDLLVHDNGNGDLPETAVDGIMYLGIAAKGGSNMAAASLGQCLANGWHGLSKNKEKAIYWLEQSLVLPGPLSDKGKELVRNQLKEIKEDTSAS